MAAVAVLAPQVVTEFAMDVRAGLSNTQQKSLPSKYLYDELGSSLFEAICLLPEYGLTRAETRILRQHADAIVSSLPENSVVAELGSGTGTKTRILLDAIRRRNGQNGQNGQNGSSGPQVFYHPIEISASALRRCESEFENVPGIRCAGVQSEYLDGLRKVADHRVPGQHLVVLFLGSSIGNFTHEEGLKFLSEVRATLQSGDALLLATDLVKPVEKLLAAYDDPTGVTAAFNRNLLGRINRELQGNFNLSKYAHQARYNEESRSIEMHLCALADQVVSIRQLRQRFRIGEGETIWTESSHKYSLPEIRELASSCGFQFAGHWLDRTWGFAENLWTVS